MKHHPIELQTTGWRFPVQTMLAFSLCIAAAAGLKAEKPAAPAEVLPERVESFKIRTRSDLNKEMTFYLRVPLGYQPKKVHRLLFSCPYMNQDSLKKMTNERGWQELADERGWFLMTCTFHMEKNTTHDRKLAYYYPETFSGKAVLDALEVVSKKYSVDTERLLLQGHSGGAQFVHRFAMLVPERVTAVAVNSSSWFDEPNARCNQMGWLLTIGESDEAYEASREMVDRLKGVGATPLFRSYLGMGHEGNFEVYDLDYEFMKFYDDLTKADLGKRRSFSTPAAERVALRGEKMPFVGDSQSWKFFRNGAEALEFIPEDSRIYLPSEEIAKLWGKKEEP